MVPPSRSFASALCWAAVLGLPVIHEAANPNQKHFHGPLRPPFTPGDAITPALGGKEMATLEAGGIVTASTTEGDTGAGCAVEDIAAPPDVVWSQLLTFETYPNKVPKVKTCANYEVVTTATTEDQKTRYVVGVVPGLSMEYYLHHVFHPKAQALTWTLDYDKRSDIDDCHGIWKVRPHPDRPDWSRVEYAADLRLRGGCPKFVLDMLTKKALVDACTWLKVESEAQHAREAAARPARAGVAAPLLETPLVGGLELAPVFASAIKVRDDVGDAVEDALSDLEYTVVDLGNAALRRATDALKTFPGFRDRLSKPVVDSVVGFVNDVPGRRRRQIKVAALAPKTQRQIRLRAAAERRDARDRARDAAKRRSR